jgi:putative serine protease PepD
MANDTPGADVGAPPPDAEHTWPGSARQVPGPWAADAHRPGTGQFAVPPGGPVPPGAGPPPGPWPQDRPPAGAPRRGPGLVVAVALVTALLGGGVGGAVGASLAKDGPGDAPPSASVLDQPLPGVDAAAAPTGAVEAVAERVLPSVVQLQIDVGPRRGEGSGMVLSPDGLLLTNNHVVEAATGGGTVTAVFRDGSRAEAEIVGRDPISDLAVLRARGVSGLRAVELGNSEAVRVGQQVVAFGAPLGLGGTVTTGIISAVDRPVSIGPDQADEATVFNALQTDAAINPGNSGGPLVDMQGRVVGVNSAIATIGGPQGGSIGVSFSIPINQAKRVAEELERTGRVSRAVLGVNIEDVPQRGGALVRSVVPGGAAEQAGIRAGDIVIRFGDQLITERIDLQAAVGSRAPGEVVEVGLPDRTVQVTLTAAPG